MARRWIGLKHIRIEPSTVCIITEGKKKATLCKLTDEDNELDFLLGRHPMKMRKVESEEEIPGLDNEDELTDLEAPNTSGKMIRVPKHHVIYKTKKDKLGIEVPYGPPIKVPALYDGLQPGDIVGMVLGGSGDMLAAAFSRRAEELETAKVLRIKASLLKKQRETEGLEKSHDHIILAKLVRDHPELFNLCSRRDRDLIRVRESYRLWKEAQHSRISCRQQMESQTVGEVFLSETGRYPEGRLKRNFEQMLANDERYSALQALEEARQEEMERVVKLHPMWEALFAEIKGFGPAAAAGILSIVTDIRRFDTVAKFKSFLGVAPTSDGKFRRKQKGQQCNWNPLGRQRLYLLVTLQFVRNQPDTPEKAAEREAEGKRPKMPTYWGTRFFEIKEKYKRKHPEPIEYMGKDGKKKKKYTPGHLHKMAIWRCATKFAEFLYFRWREIEEKWAAEEESETA